MRRVLVVVMDGVGVRASSFGNAVAAARTPQLDSLRTASLYRTLQAHGKAVGLPSDADIGNSEVGHNALGAGRVFDQGAKLVQNAIDERVLFEGEAWKQGIERGQMGHTMHFIGLLSNGNVHSHEGHLYAMLREAASLGVKRLAVHAILDGRDVGEKSAEVYVERLNSVLQELQAEGCDAVVASGGGRMRVTMDRYNADWSMVERGWKAHVLGIGEASFPSLTAAIMAFRADPKMTDQYFPSFVITDRSGKPVAPIEDGDSVIMFNFRGDRAIEICRAFTEANFTEFDRQRVPQIFFAGMMQYDGDLKIPAHFLVPPPLVGDTLSEYICRHGLRQFACSETQKFGHVTYFWNGNRSGMFDSRLETYVEIPSDNVPFDQAPAMKAAEIAQATIEAMRADSFDFGRINFANGDMVGHTGVFQAAVEAVEVVDHAIGELVEAARETDTILLITADHGNCDEMFAGEEAQFPRWREGQAYWPAPKTAHSLSPVPLYLYDPRGVCQYAWTQVEPGTLGHVANTVLTLMGLPVRAIYLPSLVEVRA